MNKISSSVIIGVAIIITAWILGRSFQNRNQNLDSITVIGLGTKDFVSDEILWSGSFTTTSFDIKTAYNKIVSDQKIVSDFFLGKGFKASEFTFGAVNFQKKFREVRSENSDNQTRYEQVFDGHLELRNLNFERDRFDLIKVLAEHHNEKIKNLFGSFVSNT